MKLLQTIALSLFFASSVLGADGIVSGEVFVVTAAGASQRLGLVKVCLYPADQMDSYLAQKREAAEGYRKQIAPALAVAERNEALARAKSDQAMKDLLAAYSLEKEQAQDLAMKQALAAGESASDVRRKMWFLDSAKYYFHGLPDPIRTVTTDSHGRYSLPVPTSGKYIVAAETSIAGGTGVKSFYWLVSVELNGATQKDLDLANNNTTTAGVPESALKTKYASIGGQ